MSGGGATCMVLAFTWQICHKKSHRYISQPTRVKGEDRYRMIVCSVVGKSYEVDGHLTEGTICHDVTDVRSLTQDDIDTMITPCAPCKRQCRGIGGFIAGVDGKKWGRVVGDDATYWRLHT